VYYFPKYIFTKQLTSLTRFDNCSFYGYPVVSVVMFYIAADVWVGREYFQLKASMDILWPC